LNLVYFVGNAHKETSKLQGTNIYKCIIIMYCKTYQTFIEITKILLGK